MSDTQTPGERFERLFTLWVDNDEGLHCYAMEAAARHMEEHGSADDAAYTLGEQLKDWCEELVGLEDMTAGIGMDFLGAAMSYIDWRAVGLRYAEICAEIESHDAG